MGVGEQETHVRKVGHLKVDVTDGCSTTFETSRERARSKPLTA
jgi:hypothetical protein